MDEIEEKLFGLFRVFRVDAERQTNEFEQVGLLAGDLEMAIVGAVWIMDIGKKRLVRVGGEQIQLSACWMDGCLIDADGSLPLQDELNAGGGITVPLTKSMLEKGGTEESHFHVSSQMMRLARSRLIVASRRRFWIIRFVSFIGCLSCCSG